MPNIRRRAIPRRGHGALNLGQRCELQFGMSFEGDGGFATREEARRAWLEHREVLMGDRVYNPPFTRPAGYWAYEAPGEPAYREDNLTALLRMKLPLTAEERALLADEAPRDIPARIPEAGTDFWIRYFRAAEIRRDWLKREGYIEQANAWGDAVDNLRASLAANGGSK